MTHGPLPLLSWLLVATLALSAACSTPGPPLDPVQAAFSESRDAVANGVEEGLNESESVDEFAVTTRYNPCRCEAPDHEIYIHGRWTRVFLDGQEKLLGEVDEQLAQDSLLTTVELRGSLYGDETTSEGVEFPVFEVSRIELR